MRDMALLILMRHGQSMWNAANLFTGLVDVPLSDKGIEEAIVAGKEISELTKIPSAKLTDKNNINVTTIK